eukprot:CAMPEP_0172719076 /NCGR_PEP_ID=MMETSP1074-20121228/75297_1 /TAXON_ID=2916 /ORGANISM="Ceratium fusus, Strain PA161109" /LENGTH=283 /DNA_ID=CAMNT_0013544389 /DNA_START=28 /DNA_END=879 /DNA_ORIENTATION=-
MSVAAMRAAGQPLRVGLMGYGAIGGYVAQRLLDGKSLPGARLSAVLVNRSRDPPAELTGPGAPVFTADANTFFNAEWDIAVEAAGQTVVREHGRRCLGDLGRHLLVTSVGALCDDGLHKELLELAGGGGSQLLIAAGALPGMDWMSSASFESVDEVSITQIKTPNGWRGTPAEEVLDLQSLTESAVVFEGSAREAATQFPKNANIAAALALSTIGLDAARVRLLADPAVPGPQVQLALRGAAGEINISVSGRPAFGSDRTSMIVPLSVVKALRNLSGPQFIGI